MDRYGESGIGEGNSYQQPPAPVKVMIARRPWISAAILLLAFALRIIWLGLKPAHFDEGVNGWFVDEMTHQGFYHYDPTNFHGPLHFYVLFLAQTLFGRSIVILRMPIVLVSTGCVGLVLAFRRYFGEAACQIAALAMAVSPAMVFYGRYAIHETWLLFFLLLTAWGLPGLWRFGERRCLWASALGATGLILTKETYIIHFAAFLLALPCLLLYEVYEKYRSGLWQWLVWVVPLGAGALLWIHNPVANYAITFIAGFGACVLFYERILPPMVLPFENWHITARDIFTAAVVSAGLILFFYTGGFLDWSAFPGLWETFSTWVRTGTEGKSGHEKEWYYWLQLIGQYEWPAVFGVVGGLWLLFPRKPRFLRYLAIYGLGALIAYSRIAYKTPWCIISIIWPFYFVFGVVAVRAAQWLDRWTIGVGAALLCLGSFGLSWKLNFYDYTDENQSYVYVQTLSDIDKLLDPLRLLTRRSPVNYQIRGHIILTEQYPFTWLLGDFPRIDYPSADELPETLDADFLLVENDHVEKVEPLLRLEYFKTPLRVRGSSENAATLYLCHQTFTGLVPSDYPIFKPGEAKPPPTDAPDSP